MPKTKIFIDALPITSKKLSGIGHISLETIKAIAALKKTSDSFEAFLLVPFDKRKYISSLGLGLGLITIPIPARLLNKIVSISSLPTRILDLFIGPGVYVFTNFRNWRLYNSKSITYIHDLVYKKYSESMDVKNHHYISSNIGTWVNRADVIITGTETTKREIEDEFGILSDCVAVIPHAVDRTVFSRRSDRSSRKTLSKYGINSTGYLLCVGNLEPRKNLEAALDAHALGSEEWRMEHPLLLIGGDGWNNSDLLERIQLETERGTVIRPAAYVQDHDLPAFYSQASILLQLAFYEGFGVSPLQALSCGTPVLLSDIEVFHDVFGEERIGVRFAKPDNIDRIYAKMQKIINSHESPSMNGIENYSWKKTANRLIDIAIEKDNTKV